jgi:hypothetical protein
MFEVCSDIYFILYNFYYVSQNDDLKICAGPIYQNEGSKTIRKDFMGRLGGWWWCRRGDARVTPNIPMLLL